MWLGLALMCQAVKEGTGGWDKQYGAYRSKVEHLIALDEP
jgi:hypothetical protein